MKVRRCGAPVLRVALFAFSNSTPPRPFFYLVTASNKLTTADIGRYSRSNNRSLFSSYPSTLARDAVWLGSGWSITEVWQAGLVELRPAHAILLPTPCLVAVAKPRFFSFLRLRAVALQ